MSKDFFNNPFSEDTNVKLELYKAYLTKWIPVFVAKKDPFLEYVNIFDLFCGPGKDSEGTHGSPLIALDVLKYFQEVIENFKVIINLYFNDQNSDYIETLKSNIESYDFKSDHVNGYFGLTMPRISE